MLGAAGSVQRSSAAAAARRGEAEAMRRVAGDTAAGRAEVMRLRRRRAQSGRAEERKHSMCIHAPDFQKFSIAWGGRIACENFQEVCLGFQG